MGNLLLDGSDNLLLVDAGLSLRVPYCDPYNEDGVTDVSGGGPRLLMKPQGQCGKLMYLAPEIINQRPFDGHATDLWAAGVVLFTILVGVEPFSIAQPSDMRYNSISRGHLAGFLDALGVHLSPEASHLLQNMLLANPRERFTLADVLVHPWVLGQHFPEKPLINSIDSYERFPCGPLGGIPEGHEEEIEVFEKPVEALMKPDNPPTEEHRKKKSGAREIFGKLKCVKKYGYGICATKHHSSVPKSQTQEVS